MLSILLSLYLFVETPAADTPHPLAAARWEKVESQAGASYRGLSLPKPGVVWASGTGNTVLTSADDGASWRVIKVGLAEGPRDFRDVWAEDERVAWIMGAGPDAASCIYHTRDGGETWTLEHGNTLAGAFYDGMTFFEKGHGLVYSDPVDGAFHLLTGRDGVWTRSTPEIPPALPGEASFAASGTGIVHLGDHVWFGTGGAAVARVFHSADRGAHWTVADTPLRAGNPAAGVFSLAFRSPTIGVAVGGKYDEGDVADGVAAYTEDGGRTWTAAPRAPRGFRGCVVYLPDVPQTLVAVGPTGGDYSADDGRTWQPLGELNLNVLKPAGQGRAWAVGPEDRVYRLDYGPREDTEPSPR